MLAPSSLVLVGTTAGEIVALDVMKAWLRVEHDEQDDLIGALVTTAVQRYEAYLNRALMAETWELRLDGFPEGAIALERPPVRSVVSVRYVDGDGALQTLAPEGYRLLGLGTDDARVAPALGAAWPGAYAAEESVLVRFAAGGPTDLPEPIRTALKLRVSNLFEHPDGGGTALSAAERDLLAPYRDPVLA